MRIDPFSTAPFIKTVKVAVRSYGTKSKKERKLEKEIKELRARWNELSPRIEDTYFPFRELLPSDEREAAWKDYKRRDYRMRKEINSLERQLTWEKIKGSVLTFFKK